MNETINNLFENMVKDKPNNIAIIDDKNEITYKILNEKINQFTYYLKEKGINKNDRVCLVMDHSIDMIIAMFAIIKSGATYIPMEPTFPIKRVNYIIEETEAIYIITQEKYKYIFDKKEKLIFYDEQLYRNKKTDNPVNCNENSTSIYILFTSGTTGKPKGVVVEHRNIYNYVDTFKSYFKITEDDRMLQCSVCTFDIFVEEVFPILLTGGTLVVASSKLLDNSLELFKLIKNKKITITSTFPYFLNDIDKEIKNEDEIPDSWKIAISGGDILRREFINKLSKKISIFNTYGPSETTVCASYYKFDENYGLTDSIPVGKPIKNVQIYIMDENLNLVSDGQIGEICISGKGVSRGYLNLDKKTKEVFVTSPFNENEIIYRTGDLGRKLPDGNIDFIKRKDEQVMIFGKRVEPLEVESVMLKSNYIKNAIVRPFQDQKGYSHLTAYYIVKQDMNEDNLKEIKKQMKQYLPNFMIPEYFVKMAEFPLTLNGKIDVKRLPHIS